LSPSLSTTTKKIIDTNEMLPNYQIKHICWSCFKTTFVQWDVTNLH